MMQASRLTISASMLQQLTDFHPVRSSRTPRIGCMHTASQIEGMPRFNNGKSTRTEPYKLFKVTGL
jgi:hypothetical protein